MEKSFIFFVLKLNKCIVQIINAIKLIDCTQKCVVNRSPAWPLLKPVGLNLWQMQGVGYAL